MRRLLAAAILAVLFATCTSDPLDRAANRACDSLRDGYDLDLALVGALAIEVDEPTTDRLINAVILRMLEECGVLLR